MKPVHRSPTRCALASRIAIVVLILSNHSLAIPKTIEGEIVVANRVIADTGMFTNGIDMGTNGEASLYWSGSPANAAVFDIATNPGSYLWRDAVTASPSFKDKMQLGAANTLTLYRSDGTTIGLTLDPNAGKITLADSEASSGIFFGTNTTATLKAAADGSAIFPSSVTLQDGLQLTGGPFNIATATPATSALAGALTVTGGISIGMDSFFNGVKIGRGAGNIGSNTVLGNDALDLNTTGINNSAMGADSLGANTTGYSNVGFGNNSGFGNTTGYGNVFIGNDAGTTEATGSNLTDPDNSIYIGANVRGFNDDDSNSIVIGANAVGEGANTTVIGNSSTVRTRLFGNVAADGLTVNNSPVITTASLSGTLQSSPQTSLSSGSATGDQSTAMSGGAANGSYASAAGYQTDSSSYSSTTLGSRNTSWGSPDTWVETDPILLVGNGQTTASNAITTLKNGQTTLTNKTWKHRDAQTVPATADPSTEETDSEGNALVVEGHTVLNGKVIISVPQGDISMGIYQ